MLIVAGSITFDPAHHEVAEAAATTMMEATMAEPGCQNYVFSVQFGSPSTIQVFEVWDSEEDLKAHFAMPHMADFQAAIAGIGISGRDLMKYQVSSSEPM